MIDPSKAANMSFLWGAILYQWASSIFLINFNYQTEIISAVGYLIGSALFALSDVIRIFNSTKTDRIMNCAFFFADSLLTIGSIFFFPSLQKVIIGNCIFETAGWLNCINHTIMWIRMCNKTEDNWKIAALSRFFNHLGGVLFIVGNILLINNAKLYFTQGFIIFTTGSVGFNLGGSLSFFIQSSKHKKKEKKNDNIEGNKSQKERRNIQIHQEITLQNIQPRQFKQ